MVPVTEWPASTRADRHPRRGRETGGQSTEEGTVTPQAESGQAVASRTRPVAESEPPSRKSVGDEPDTRDPRAAGPETTSGDPVAAMSAAAEDSFRDIGRERPLASPEAVAAVSATAAPPVSAPALGEAPAISATEIAPERATEFVTRFAGLFYLVMELVEGRSLEAERARFGDVGWALPLVAQLARALAAGRPLPRPCDGAPHRRSRRPGTLASRRRNRWTPSAARTYR